MKLTELLDRDLLDEMLAGGYIRTRFHPTLPLQIFNYAEKAQYERVWNEVTRTCRGLIVDTVSGEVVARPFPKFFNHGEEVGGVGLDTSGPVCVTDKLDGSLGILYPTGPGRFAIATRGSFISDQAVHATELWARRYAPAWTPRVGLTYLFEIIYPDNRIVVDYGTLDELVLLAVVSTEAGRTLPHSAHGWPGTLVPRFPYGSLAEALSAPPRPGAEGLVVHFLTADQRLKIKQADYVALHRTITGLTARRLWERCAVHATLTAHPDLPVKRAAQALRMSVDEVRGIQAAGPGWLEEARRMAPEEFLEWIDATVTGLTERAEQVRAIAEKEALSLRDRSRRDAALAIQDHPYRSLIFAALDGKPITAQAWAAVYPDQEDPFRPRTEDTA
jgi:RNA ligase